jgi:hypothetical protein
LEWNGKNRIENAVSLNLSVLDTKFLRNSTRTPKIIEPQPGTNFPVDNKMQQQKSFHMFVVSWLHAEMDVETAVPYFYGIACYRVFQVVPKRT